MPQHVADLVHLAALHERTFAVHAADRSPQRLAAVDDEQARAIRPKAAVSQIGEHRGASLLVFGCALPEPEHVLRAGRVHAERAENDVVTEMDAVDEHSPEIELAERSRLPLVELRLRERDEAPTYSALARSARFDVLGENVERARVLPRRDPDRHLL